MNLSGRQMNCKSQKVEKHSLLMPAFLRTPKDRSQRTTHQQKDPQICWKNSIATYAKRTQKPEQFEISVCAPSAHGIVELHSIHSDGFVELTSSFFFCV